MNGQYIYALFHRIFNLNNVLRKIRENARALLDEARILPFIKLFRDQLWPGGKLKPSSTTRTSEEKIRTRDEANRKLSSLVPGMWQYLQHSRLKLTFHPDLAANMIGRSNARRGARRMFAVLQNRRLNQHIAYTVADEVWFSISAHLVNTIDNLSCRSSQLYSQNPV